MGELRYLTGSTEHLVSQALFCAFWTYAQTAWLLLEEGGVDELDLLSREVYEPGLTAMAGATPSQY